MVGTGGEDSVGAALDGAEDDGLGVGVEVGCCVGVGDGWADALGLGDGLGLGGGCGVAAASVIAHSLSSDSSRHNSMTTCCAFAVCRSAMLFPVVFSGLTCCPATVTVSAS